MIISPEQFKKVKWKNGKGETIELAINDGGSMSNFDWRLSIASVVEDGEFSDFSGYQRNLILIEGDNILLEHDGCQSNHLTESLSFATFDGGSKTMGTISNGAIKDFNLMHDAQVYDAQVETYQNKKCITLRAADYCFVYCLQDEAQIAMLDDKQELLLKAGHLLKLSALAANQLQVCGIKMIVIYLHKK